VRGNGLPKFLMGRDRGKRKKTIKKYRKECESLTMRQPKDPSRDEQSGLSRWTTAGVGRKKGERETCSGPMLEKNKGKSRSVGRPESEGAEGKQLDER